MKRYYYILFFLCMLAGISLPAQVWQWSVPVANARNADAHAFLWVPENCKQVKAVVVTQNNMEELSIVENDHFRQQMGRLSVAIIWVSPAFDLFFNFSAVSHKENFPAESPKGDAAVRKPAGDIFNSMMNELAAVSGYTELQYAPIIGMGHSAAASWPYYFAAWNPGRTLACISVSGQWPYVRHPQFAPDIWTKDQHIDFIPCLETMGEYEAADTWSTEGLKERKEHPFLPLSMLACPAEGHFATTEKKIRYIAFYIAKAARYRLPHPYPATGAPVLKRVDPTTTGWLMDKWRKDQLPIVPAAPVGKYTGDTTQAFWFFDEETVRITEQYQAAWRNKKAQLLGYVQEGKTVKQRNSHLQAEMSFIPQPDGITFHLKGAFLDTVPGESERPKTWTGLPVGAAVGHAQNNIPVVVDRIIGPFEKISDTVFRLQLQKGLPAQPKNYVFTLAATHPGDAIYKPAVQQGQMTAPVANKEGAEQAIRFNTIGPLKKGTRSITLQAVSTAGLPVSFYVREGPAQVKGNRLHFTKIPPRSKFPVKVTVVAWQYGRGNEPKIKTASTIEQSFYIVP
ncbi:hypothetical protein HB364_32325 [Pseudoflavitalea sp. X16]|uniref:hypothetical protein n=1 Tax=Paraflavitalea devenefica TaxID=2716334 RepID=UPI00141DABBE|nr:hypothetical protein [Paraflavitalea devenefica]NII29809.1 hypothetical protein [Paraflavitalea devenefica]